MSGNPARQRRSVLNVETGAGRQAGVLRAADLGRRRLDLHWAAGQASTTVSNVMMRAGGQPGVLRAADVGRGRKDLDWAAAREENSTGPKKPTTMMSSSIRDLRQYTMPERRSNRHAGAERAGEMPKPSMRVRSETMPPNRSYQVKHKISAKVLKDMLVRERMQRPLPERRPNGPDEAERVVELPNASTRVRRETMTPNRSYQVKHKISAKVEKDMLVAERIQRLLSTTELINERAQKTKVISFF
eukprot:CAMPEP_0113964876 /NCGR_PEP_ID=MMETSP0011_2-20120614/7413_1 /TAXON_ID=101924 /ORGANISM="Rhodosorus marinus" /LENGTH=244 /DNA_ID=CAMNT_0000977287 /DNA_START=137 /DNA_END=871 /DNA_ORIENTATION=- /assembly_acc=CAM_ASM_000156